MTYTLPVTCRMATPSSALSGAPPADTPNVEHAETDGNGRLEQPAKSVSVFPLQLSSTIWAQRSGQHSRSRKHFEVSEPG